MGHAAVAQYRPAPVDEIDEAIDTEVGAEVVVPEPVAVVEESVDDDTSWSDEDTDTYTEADADVDADDDDEAFMAADNIVDEAEVDGTDVPDLYAAYDEPEAVEDAEVDAIDDDIVESEDETPVADASDEDEDEVDADDGGESARRAVGESRYARQSRRLPRIGDDAGSVLASIAGLRKTTFNADGQDHGS